MAQVKEVEIEGERYTIGQLVPSKAQEVLVLLVKTVGPGIGEALASGGSLTSLVKGQGLKSLGRALQDLVLRIEAKDLSYLCKVFGEVCHHAGVGSLASEKNQLVHFQGRLLLQFRWLGACLEHNYSDFFDLGRSVMSSEAGSPQPERDSPTPSEGKA